MSILINKPSKQVEIDRNKFLEDFVVPEIDWMTDEELLELTQTEMVLDVECYPNFFIVEFKSLVNGKVVHFELSEHSILNIEKLNFMLWHFKTIGFNSLKYDLVIIICALAGFTCKQLKEVSDSLIKFDNRPHDILKNLKLSIPKELNHIDIIEIPAGSASLKVYSGRLHCPKMQDLPFDPDKPLNEKQMIALTVYCINDLDNTILLYNHLRPQIDLREKMSLEYRQDLRSRSDAQVAEHVIASEVARINGNWPKRPLLLDGTTYRYLAPAFLQFQTSGLSHVLDLICSLDFGLDKGGSIAMPEELESLLVPIGKAKYKFGVGGLHSTEKSLYYVADDDCVLIDRDVTSYYPSIILNQRLYPKHMGTIFLEIYKNIVDRRIAAKKAGITTVADSLKITINGSFGKFGNKYSSLYSPDLLLQTTVTGQLSLLMLIESIELVGIRVVSANTDGVVIKCPKNKLDELNQVISNWEKTTGFITEEARYKAIYSRDVNNYIAVKDNGKLKLKGCFAETTISKNPENSIAIEALCEFLTKGVPLAKTIRECNDIRKFVTVRSVTGGAHKDGVYLGKVVRFYRALGETGCLNYIKSGNKVPNSDGCKPLMNLPEEFPNDVDFEAYEKEAESMLFDIGFFRKKKYALILT